VRLLLDTHTVFWALTEPRHLSGVARVALEDKNNEIMVSIASAWEMAIKVGTGKWPEAAALVDALEAELLSVSFRLLPIEPAHARLAGLMPAAHRDPFDRMLAAQAIIDDLTLVTVDAKVAGLGAKVLW
jgi:PIN domain nuclease of toxin-antitoxin system